jgi:CRISPR-associated endoribonuclease Cas6
MRIKISFLREHSSANSIPLHHQKLLADSLGEMLDEIGGDRSSFNFSSLKGTSKITNGFMRFLSSKITLVISSKGNQLAEAMVQKIFDSPHLAVGKMHLIPKTYEVIPDPSFQTKMRYLCISPLIMHNPDREPEQAQEMVDPTSQQFSDLLYNITLDRMERAGYSEAQLNEFAEFEAQPDIEYINKINESGKKYARFYKSAAGNTMLGLLLPFTLHAHPEVHKYIWEVGLGVLTEEGYGMIDMVRI